MDTNDNKRREGVVRKAIVSVVIFILISAVLIPQINSQIISEIKEKIENKTMSFKPISNNLNEYTLTIIIEGNGTVNKDPDQTSYPEGTIVTLTAIPSTEWNFDHWGGDLTGSQNPTTITMNGNKTVTANFTINHYILTINNVGNGVVIQYPPTQTTYPYGTVVMLTAIPDEDWVFSHWGGDLTGNNNPENITIDENKTVIAYFTLNEYTISFNIYGQGDVIKVPDYNTYPYGTIVELTAVPAYNWTFDHWSGDINGTDNPKEILVNGNKVINVFFKGDSTEPLVEIIRPTKGIYYKDIKIFPFFVPAILNSITIEAKATDNDSSIEKVEFYIDGNLKGTDTTSPYQYLWDENSSGKHNIEVKAYDNSSNSATTDLDVFKVTTKFPWLLILIIIVIIVIAYLREN